MCKVCWMVLLATFSCATISQESDFVFRNDDRPSFEQIISINQLSEKQNKGSLVLLDVRLKEDFENDPVMIPGAIYLDPEDLSSWSSSLIGDSEVVVYCVKGKWVSQKVAYILNQQGINVSSLEGGIEAWKESKGR